MTFDVYGSKQSESTSDKPEVDWDALNHYVVDTAGLKNRETLVGYISAIVDLGTQEQPDAELKFVGTVEEEAEAIEEHPDTYFKDGVDENGKECRLKCFPQKPIQCVTYAVDFPDILLDKGQFFGDDSGTTKPLRLWMGNQFYLENKGMVVGRPIPLRVGNVAQKGSKKPVWSFKPNHSLYKLALAAKLIQPGDVFLPRDIDKLLGVSLQFEAQVFFKKAKNGKEYYTEYLKFVGGLGRKMEPLELVTAPSLIMFNQKNDEDSVKELRNHVVNTIKMASNYEGSMIQKQIEGSRGEESRREESSNNEDTHEQEEEPSEDEGGDVPF